MKYTTNSFVRGFMEGTLGKKRTHSSYRVLQGDHCRVLVKSETEGGQPIGNVVVAVEFNIADGPRLVFFKSKRMFRWRVANEVGTGLFQEVPGSLIDNHEKDILNSGVVDADGSHVLIELGDVPFLFTYRLTEDKYIKQTKGNVPAFDTVQQIPNRVPTVAKALELLGVGDGNVMIANTWEAQPMPLGFKPPVLDAVWEATLSKGINPLDFGYDLLDCVPRGNGLVPIETLNDSTPTDARYRAWVAAVETWKMATKKYNDMYPAYHSDLDVRKGRYTMEDANRIGTIVASASGVFVKGKVRPSGDWNSVEDLFQWHKLISKREIWTFKNGTSE